MRETSSRWRGLEQRLGRRVRRLRGRLRLWAVAGAASAVALAFFAASLYLYLAQTLAPWAAASIAGGVAAAVAGAAALAAHWLGRRSAAPKSDHEELRRTAEAAIDELLGGGKLKASDVVMVSLVAGVVLGASPALRHQLAAFVGRRVEP